jgi:hypothetical protein
MIAALNVVVELAIRRYSVTLAKVLSARDLDSESPQCA